MRIEVKVTYPTSGAGSRLGTHAAHAPGSSGILLHQTRSRIIASPLVSKGEARLRPLDTNLYDTSLLQMEADINQNLLSAAPKLLLTWAASELTLLRENRNRRLTSLCDLLYTSSLISRTKSWRKEQGREERKSGL